MASVPRQAARLLSWLQPHAGALAPLPHAAAGRTATAVLATSAAAPRRGAVGRPIQEGDTPPIETGLRPSDLIRHVNSTPPGTSYVHRGIDLAAPQPPPPVKPPERDAGAKPRPLSRQQYKEGNARLADFTRVLQQVVNSGAVPFDVDEDATLHFLSLFFGSAAGRDRAGLLRVLLESGKDIGEEMFAHVQELISGNEKCGRDLSIVDFLDPVRPPRFQ